MKNQIKEEDINKLTQAVEIAEKAHTVVCEVLNNYGLLDYEYCLDYANLNDAIYQYNDIDETLDCLNTLIAIRSESEE